MSVNKGDERKAGDLPPRRRVHYGLLAIPFVWQLALAPYVNGIVIRGCPIPFPMLWQMLGVVLASTIIAIVFHIDRRMESAQTNDPPDGSAP
jgi:hypothetical protein